MPKPQKYSEYNRESAKFWGSTGAHLDDLSRSIADAIEAAVKSLRSHHREKILDIGCGTGWASRQIAHSNPQAKVMGVDFSRELIRAAKSFANAYDLPLDFKVAQAEQLPFGTATFDKIISTFGLIFAENPQAVASELARTCRPGGRIAITAWIRNQTERELRGAFQGLPPLGIHDPWDLFYLWSDREFVRDLLGAHFKLEFKSHKTRVYSANEQQLLDLWERTTLQSNFKKISFRKRQKVRKLIIRFLRKFKTGRGICLEREYLLITGVRRGST